jgi:hypothetical protein
MPYGPLIILAILFIAAAASALAWQEGFLVRGRRLAARYDRRYQANLAARNQRRPRT